MAIVKKSILDTEVSMFNNYRDAAPKTINLLQWLQDDKHKEKVERIRAIEDKAERDKIKATLPCITVSGVFSTRAIAGLVKHSGLICIDIDYKDNLQVENYGDLKQILSTAPFVAYCGMSVSGTGYFVVVPIKYPGKHDMQFEALHRMYERLGVNIDISGKDVSRLRGYSWDSAAYINHEASPYGKVYEEPQLVKLSFNSTKYARRSGNDTRTWVEKYITALSAKGIDITEGYKQWLRLGFAFATEFGEAGRQYFHDVSRNYSGYKPGAADKQYTHCLNSRGHGVTIKTFFYLCKAQGVTLQ